MTGPRTDLAAALAAALAGRYRIDAPVGEGGMAVVYRAHDLREGRPVALKVLRPELAAILGPERFQREIHITASLQHPNILPLFESGAADGQLYYTMPLVTGETLRERLDREGPLAAAAAVAIAGDVAAALHHAHAQGFVHRDVKPENILLSGGRAVVADFGVARVVAAAGTDRVSSAGLAIGTPAYMSPEQAAGSPTIDGRSDIYALGCVVYEMLAGEPPFTGPSPQAVLARQVSAPIPSLAVLRPALGAALVRAIEAALAKSPADRPATAEAFADLLRAGLTDARPAGAAPPRRVPLVALSAVAVVAVVAAGVLWLRPAPLDPMRVVVFPAQVPSGSPAELGRDIATFIGHVLEGTDPLRWEEGAGRGARASDDAGHAALARRRRARWFVDGTVITRRDSVTVVLRLHDAAGDSVVRSAGRSGPLPSSEVRLAALAMGELLPALLAPGRRVDVSPFADRSVAAVAQFLLAERAYRQYDYAAALAHYQQAVAADSLFALAAIRGAMTANWLERADLAHALVTLAVRHRRLVSGRHQAFLLGAAAYLEASADSAVAHYRRALALSPDWAEGWAALGEVYEHLLPNEPRTDTLALAAFRRAWAADSGFVPAQLHLMGHAVADADAAGVRRYASRFRALARDSGFVAVAALVERAVTAPLSADDWRRLVRDDVGHDSLRVVTVAANLAQSPRFDAQAEFALRALIADDSVRPGYRLGATIALQSVLMRAGRTADVRALLTSPIGTRFGMPYYFMHLGLIDSAFAREADSAAAAQGGEYARMPDGALQPVALWLAHRGRLAEARAAAAALRARADSGRAPSTRLLADLVEAHVTLAAGDTAGAMRRLSALRPTGAPTSLMWRLSPALGLERLTLARLQLARGDAAGALRTADMLDAPAPLGYYVYARAGLALRVDAARRMGDRARAREYAQRLAALGAAGNARP